MSKICPVSHSIVLYLDCLECDDKICRQNGKSKYEQNKASEDNMKNKIVIGIDQSYKDTGITISYKNEIKCITHCFTANLENNTEKRKALKLKLQSVFFKAKMLAENKNAKLVCLIERIRLQSDGFINIDYIKSIGALNAMIVDTANEYGIEVYSVDTRAWKSSIVGTSKPMENKFGLDPKKWPTILYLINKGYEEDLLLEVSKRKKKGIVKYQNGIPYTYNDNAADSACISLYGFCEKQNLKKEH